MTKFEILAALAVPVRHKTPLLPLAKIALGFAIPIIGWAYSLAALMQIAENFRSDSINPFASLDNFRASVLRGGVLCLPVFVALAFAFATFWIPSIGVFLSCLITITFFLMVMPFLLPHFATQSDLSLRFNIRDSIDYIGKNALNFLLLYGVIIATLLLFCTASGCMFHAGNMMATYGKVFHKIALPLKICAGITICFALAVTGEIFAAFSGTIYRISKHDK